MFLVGPFNQIKSMAQPNRLLSSLIFLGAMIFSLISALLFNSSILVLLLVIIQICALIWYN